MLELNGIPLLGHSILYAQSNPEVSSDIYVTTDNAEIKSLALDYGVKVIDRPKELSGDLSTTVSALKHALLTVDEDYDTVILLQPTNPLRPKDLLASAFKTYKEADCDSLMTVSLNDKKLGKINNGRFEPYTYKMGQRSQDIEPLYYENGLLYISSTELILNDAILGKRNSPYIVDHPYASVDIDTAEDLRFAQYIIENYPNE